MHPENQINLLDLGVARAHVFITKAPENTNPLGGILGDGSSNPLTHWVQVRDENPVTVDEEGNPLTLAEIAEGSLLMRWVDVTGSPPNSLVMDLDTPNLKGEAGVPNNDDINGAWHFRVVFFDNPLLDPDTGEPADGTDFKVCEIMDESQRTLPLPAQPRCLFGEPFDPQSNFLIDFVDPTLDEADQEFATGKIILQLPKPFKGFDEQGNPLPDTLIPLLQDIIDNAQIIDNTKSKLGTVIEKIQASLDPKYWIDTVELDADESGQTVFQEEEAAAKELATLLGFPPGSGIEVTETNQAVLTELREIIALIETDDRVLAETAIELAIIQEGEGGSCQANANIEMANAENSLLLLDFENAINFREAAWVWAQHDLAGEPCDPIGSAPPPPAPVPEPEPPGEIPGEVIIGGTESGDRTINAGESLTLLDGVIFNGNIMVNGGTLIVSDSTVNGKIDAATEMSSVTIIDGSIISDEVIVAKSGSTLVLIESTVGKDVKTTELFSLRVIDNILIGGDLISDKDEIVEADGNTNVGGKIEITDAGSCSGSNCP